MLLYFWVCARIRNEVLLQKKKQTNTKTHQKRTNVSKAIQVLFGVPAGAKDPVLIVGASLVRQQNTS